MKRILKILGLILFGAIIGFIGGILLVRYAYFSTIASEREHYLPKMSEEQIRYGRAHLYYLHLIEENNIDRLKALLDAEILYNVVNSWDWNRGPGTPFREEYVNMVRLADYYYTEKRGMPETFSPPMMSGVPKATKSDYEKFCQDPGVYW